MLQIIQKNLPAEKIKVLVVEDVILNQLLLKIILLDFDDIDLADNGKIAIEKFQKNTMTSF
jgi:CheY-like chemotaxis protein